MCVGRLGWASPASTLFDARPLNATRRMARMQGGRKTPLAGLPCPAAAEVNQPGGTRSTLPSAPVPRPGDQERRSGMWGQELLGHRDVSTTMRYPHVPNRGGLEVQIPADLLDLGDGAVLTDQAAGGTIVRRREGWGRPISKVGRRIQPSSGTGEFRPSFLEGPLARAPRRLGSQLWSGPDSPAPGASRASGFGAC